MNYVFIGGALILLALALFQLLRGVRKRVWLKLLRWTIGGLAGVLALVMLFLRRVELASILGVTAFAILVRGRIGPFTFEVADDGPTRDTISRVRSRYLSMALDHETGAVHGEVIAGQFAGADLIDLGEAETRALFAEIARDADSVSLLESWLDANRAGWREYFEETARAGSGAPGTSGDRVAEAYAVLGLSPGASIEDVRAAHRELMKAVHPDHGGSAFLAARINEARDVLVEALGGTAR